MKKYLWLIILAVFIIGLAVVAIVFSPSENLKEAQYKEITNKIKDKDTFILYIKSTDCEHCKAFTPTFTSVLSKYDIKAYALNLANLSDEDNEEYTKEFSDVEGTPTVLFYKDGERQMVTIEGEQSKTKVISKLKTAGFIK